MFCDVGDVVLLLHALDELVDELVDLVLLHGLLELFPDAIVEQLAGFEELTQGFAKIVEGVVEILKARYGSRKPESSR